MRALKWFGLGLSTVAIVAACGGESSSDGDPPAEGEGGAGNDTGNPGGAVGDAGESGVTGGMATSGGRGSGGGKATGGSKAAGGSTSPPRGGSSSAGSPNPGTGGVSPEGGTPSNPPPPEDCELVSQSSAVSYCEQSWSCGGNNQAYTSCSDQGGGSWMCSCKSSAGGGQYMVRNLSGLGVCTSITDLCLSGEVPEDAGPEECATMPVVRDLNFCVLQQQCAVPLDVEGGNIYRLTRAGDMVQCNSNGVGGSSCSCKNASYELSGIAGNTSCEVLADFCFEPNGGFSSEPVCMQAGQSVGAGYCSIQHQCTQSEEIGEGVFAVRNSYRNAECTSTAGTDGAKCYCSDESGSAQFDLATGSADFASCSLAEELCGQIDSVELSGEIECSQASQVAQGDYCNSQFSCSQSGTVDGVDVRVHGSIMTDCYANGSDAWSCTCLSGNVSDSITLNKSGTPWDDCTAASELCQETIDVQIGQSGGPFPVPPFPLPL